MPSNLVKTDRDEELWSKAKARAAEQGHKEDWAYVNGIYQRMKGHKKTASRFDTDKVTPDVSTPILNAIKPLSSDGWYGFKPDKNKYNTPVMRFFTPTSDYPGNTITPRPKKIIDALRAVDWMSIPSDNIDGHPTKGNKEYQREKEVFDHDYKKASLLHAISSLEITKDMHSANIPIHRSDGDEKQAELCEDVAKSCGVALTLLDAIQKEATTKNITYITERGGDPDKGDGFAYSEALAGESVPDDLGEYNEKADCFNGVTHDDLERFARIVAYKVADNLEEGFEMNPYINPLQKIARVLSSRGRKQVKKKNFAMPASAAKSGEGQKGSYPVHDIKHARSALSYGSRFLSSEEYGKLKKRVYNKYPSLKKEGTMRTPLLDSAKQAVLGGTTFGESLAMNRANRNAALNVGAPTRTSRPGLLSRLMDTRTRLMARSVSARNR